MTIYINGGTISVDTTQQSVSYIDDTDSPYTMTATEEALMVDCQNGAVSVTTNNSQDIGDTIIISDLNGYCSLNNITIDSPLGTIDGANFTILNNDYASITIMYLGSNNWKII